MEYKHKYSIRPNNLGDTRKKELINYFDDPSFVHVVINSDKINNHNLWKFVIKYYFIAIRMEVTG
jgi:hypothetical protein